MKQKTKDRYKNKKNTMTRCKYCKSQDNLTIDHKVPVVKGGLDSDRNLQCLCFKCNTMKSDLTHKQVVSLFKWFLQIQESRVIQGKKPYTLK